jgi:hypothetical protein
MYVCRLSPRFCPLRVHHRRLGYVGRARRRANQTPLLCYPNDSNQAPTMVRFAMILRAVVLWIDIDLSRQVRLNSRLVRPTCLHSNLPARPTGLLCSR